MNKVSCQVTVGVDVTSTDVSSTFTSSFCVESSSLLNCRALSASVQQILHDLPEKLCFSFLIRHIARSFPFESDQSVN